jgi:hypothetical protein
MGAARASLALPEAIGNATPEQRAAALGAEVGEVERRERPFLPPALHRAVQLPTRLRATSIALRRSAGTAAPSRPARNPGRQVFRPRLSPPSLPVPHARTGAQTRPSALPIFRDRLPPVATGRRRDMPVRPPAGLQDARSARGRGEGAAAGDRRPARLLGASRGHPPRQPAMLGVFWRRGRRNRTPRGAAPASRPCAGRSRRGLWRRCGAASSRPAFSACRGLPRPAAD